MDAKGKLAAQIQRLIKNEALEELPQLARFSDATFPSETLFLHAYIKEFLDAWAKVIGSWKTHEGSAPGSNDRWHVETHAFRRRDIFIRDGS